MAEGVLVALGERGARGLGGEQAPGVTTGNRVPDEVQVLGGGDRRGVTWEDAVWARFHILERCCA